jgi:hypothetical protein
MSLEELLENDYILSLPLVQSFVNPFSMVRTSVYSGTYVSRICVDTWYNLHLLAVYLSFRVWVLGVFYLKIASKLLENLFTNL